MRKLLQEDVIRLLTSVRYYDKNYPEFPRLRDRIKKLYICGCSYYIMTKLTLTRLADSENLDQVVQLVSL